MWKSGSGKSTLANILTKNKTTIHIDVDKIGHEIYELEEVKKLMLKEFGNNIYKENKIDRASLGKIVFKSKKQMEKLTQITWPSMEKKIDNIINQTNTDIIIDWLLLPKTKFFKMCDTKILLDIPYDIRKRRCLKRDNITPEKFKQREQASIKYNEKDFDIIIKNNEILERIINKL